MKSWSCKNGTHSPDKMFKMRRDNANAPMKNMKNSFQKRMEMVLQLIRAVGKSLPSLGIYLWGLLKGRCPWKSGPCNNKSLLNWRNVHAKWMCGCGEYSFTDFLATLKPAFKCFLDHLIIHSTCSLAHHGASRPYIQAPDQATSTWSRPVWLCDRVLGWSRGILQQRWRR